MKFNDDTSREISPLHPTSFARGWMPVHGCLGRSLERSFTGLSIVDITSIPRKGRSIATVKSGRLCDIDLECTESGSPGHSAGARGILTEDSAGLVGSEPAHYHTWT